MFGQAGGGACLDRALQSITADSYRARGISGTFSGGLDLWSYGMGASYNRRHYHRPILTGITYEGATEDESVSVYANIGRQLSRVSSITLGAYASWYDNDLATFDTVTSQGASISYSRSFMLERLQFLAALGFYHSEAGAISSSNGAASAGLRYTF